MLKLSIKNRCTWRIYFVVSFRNVGLGTSTAAARVSAFASVYAPLLVRLTLDYIFHRPTKWLKYVGENAFWTKPFFNFLNVRRCVGNQNKYLKVLIDFSNWPLPSGASQGGKQLYLKRVRTSANNRETSWLFTSLVEGLNQTPPETRQVSRAGL